MYLFRITPWFIVFIRWNLKFCFLSPSFEAPVSTRRPSLQWPLDPWDIGWKSWKIMEHPMKTLIYGWFMGDLWLIHGWFMVDLWLIHGWFMENPMKTSDDLGIPKIIVGKLKGECLPGGDKGLYSSSCATSVGFPPKWDLLWCYDIKLLARAFVCLQGKLLPRQGCGKRKKRSRLLVVHVFSIRSSSNGWLSTPVGLSTFNHVWTMGTNSTICWLARWNVLVFFLNVCWLNPPMIVACNVRCVFWGW